MLLILTKRKHLKRGREWPAKMARFSTVSQWDQVDFFHSTLRCTDAITSFFFRIFVNQCLHRTTQRLHSTTAMLMKMPTIIRYIPTSKKVKCKAGVS